MGIIQVAGIFLIVYHTYTGYKRSITEAQKSNGLKDFVDKIREAIDKAQEGKQTITSANINHFVDAMMLACRQGVTKTRALQNYAEKNNVVINEGAYRTASQIWIEMRHNAKEPVKKDPLQDALHNVVFDKKEDMPVSEEKDMDKEAFDRQLAEAEHTRPNRADYGFGNVGEEQYQHDYRGWWNRLPKEVADYLSVEN